MSKIKDYEAVEISKQAYNNKITNIPVNINGQRINWRVVETINDKDTGLQGYVLQNPKTEEVVVSFRGTELPKVEKKQVEQKYVGSPSQDARLAGAGGGATLKDGNIVYDGNSITGIDKAEKDLTEDIQGIVFGDSNYTKKEYGTTEYIASPSQDAALSTGKAKLNSKEKTITYINKNQFTESEKIIADTVKKYGADNITFVGHSLGGGLAQYYAVKHDSNAITFAAADVYSLLSEEEQQEVAKGKFKDNIISYTYPDDFVGTFYNDSIGSVYYMSEPKDSSKGISTHKIKNYMVEDLYDKEGYFLPSTLYDEKIHRQLASSPLKMKNKGVENFYIRIQGSLMAAYVKELEGSSELIEATRKALVNFLDFYVESMTELKNTYLAKVGTGQYDKLSAAHVNEYFADYTNIDEEGVPMLLDIEEFEGLMSMIGKALSDTDEIAYHMEKMSNDFNEADTQLAQWLQLKK